MTRVKLASVRTFPNVQHDKAQALKVLEEASETVEAFKKWFLADWASAEFVDLMDEIADTIQACCNLAASLDVTDLTPYLARCEEMNRRRGRYER